MQPIPGNSTNAANTTKNEKAYISTSAYTSFLLGRSFPPAKTQLVKNYYPPYKHDYKNARAQGAKQTRNICTYIPYKCIQKLEYLLF